MVEECWTCEFCGTSLDTKDAEIIIFTDEPSQIRFGRTTCVCCHKCYEEHIRPMMYDNWMLPKEQWR